MSSGLRTPVRRAIMALNQTRAFLVYRLYDDMEGVCRLLRTVNKASVPAILRQFGATVGENCDIDTGLVLHEARHNFSHLVIEDGCHIGKDVLLDLTGSITIRRNSTVSMRSIILTHFDTGHADLGPAYAAGSAPVEIGPDAYLGAGTMVLAGACVGSRTLVAAGAVVTGSLPARVVAGGVPARVIRPLENTSKPA